MSQNEDVEYRKAVSKYAASFMSNAKWLKLFRAVIKAGIVVEHAHWRFIDSDHTIQVSFPEERDLEPTRFSDGKFQPFEYRWIESVYIPTTFRPIPGVGYEKKQDTVALVAALKKVGHFPVEVTSEGITIMGYRR